MWQTQTDTDTGPWLVPRMHSIARTRGTNITTHNINFQTPKQCKHIIYINSNNNHCVTDKCTHTRLTALFPGPPGWAGTRKVKPNWNLLKQETVCGSGISWTICKSAPRSRQITMPAPHHSVFYRLDALPATQPTASKHWRDTLTNAMNYIIVIGINVKSAWNSSRMISAQSADSLSPRVTIEYCCYHNAETDFIMFVYILKIMIYTYKPLESPGLSVWC